MVQTLSSKPQSIKYALRCCRPRIRPLLQVHEATAELTANMNHVSGGARVVG